MGIDRNAMGSSVSVAAFWFSGAVANNITTKHALKMVPLPLTVCAVGMLVNILISQLISLGSPARVAPRRTELTQLRTVLPLSCCTEGAFICHRLALASGSVAFTITVKSSNVAITALLATVSGSMLRDCHRQFGRKNSAQHTASDGGGCDPVRGDLVPCE